MKWQSPSWAFEKIHALLMFTAALFTIAKTWTQMNVHWQMNGQRRCGASTRWNTTQSQRVTPGSETPWTIAHQALPMGFTNSPPGSARGILQARILEWATMPSCRGIFPTQGLKLHLLQLLHNRQILYRWATGEAHLSPLFYGSTLNLQCCFNFHHTAKWFIYIYIYIYICSFQVLFHYHKILGVIPCAIQ